MKRRTEECIYFKLHDETLVKKTKKAYTCNFCSKEIEKDKPCIRVIQTCKKCHIYATNARYHPRCNNVINKTGQFTRMFKMGVSRYSDEKKAANDAFFLELREKENSLSSVTLEINNPLAL